MSVVQKIIVLDAMGVIYSVKDDVQDLLYPFIAEKSGCENTEEIRELYIAASLGKMSSLEFWEAVDINPELEEEYLQRHTLTEGILEFLEEANHRGHEIWCLSNDLSEWSRKLRTRFKLEKKFAGFVISGDVGFRKPEEAIYREFLTQSLKNASEAIFIDDSRRNLDSAALLGFETVLFKTDERFAIENHKLAFNFDDVLSLLL
jgi:HAD superfamily hydrolase (TIGR01509 family)